MLPYPIYLRKNLVPSFRLTQFETLKQHGTSWRVDKYVITRRYTRKTDLFTFASCTPVQHVSSICECKNHYVLHTESAVIVAITAIFLMTVVAKTYHYQSLPQTPVKASVMF